MLFAQCVDTSISTGTISASVKRKSVLSEMRKRKSGWSDMTSSGQPFALRLKA